MTIEQRDVILKLLDGLVNLLSKLAGEDHLHKDYSTTKLAIAISEARELLNAPDDETGEVHTASGVESGKMPNYVQEALHQIKELKVKIATENQRAEEWAKHYYDEKKRADFLDGLIGKPPPGAHEDERYPRSQTWIQERANWINEVEALKDFVRVLEAGNAGRVEYLRTVEALKTTNALNFSLEWRWQEIRKIISAESHWTAEEMMERIKKLTLYCAEFTLENTAQCSEPPRTAHEHTIAAGGIDRKE